MPPEELLDEGGLLGGAGGGCDGRAVIDADDPKEREREEKRRKTD